MEVESETSCNESEASCNGENDIAYERYSDEEEEPELDQIKRKKFYPQCIIDSDSNSDGENSVAISQEPQSIDLTESSENGQFTNVKDGPGETSRDTTTLDNISNIYMLSNNKNLTERDPLSRENTMNSPENFPEMGANVSDMVQNILQSRHPGISPLQCSECDLECPSLPALEFHTKLHVMERIAQSSYEYPGIGLRRPSDKVNLQNGMHNEVSRETSEETSYSNSGSGYSGERPHKCDECGFRFTSITHLKRHMLTHTGEKPFACTECDYRCARNDKLKIHMQAHNAGQKLFACTECDYSSGRKDKLKDHMETHVSGQKQYACTDFVSEVANISSNGDNNPGAEREINNESDIPTIEDTHIERLTHSAAPTTGDIKIKKIKRAKKRKGFNCPKCDYKCTSTSLLKLLMAKHPGESPFKCTECDSWFKAKNNLKEHMLTHLTSKCFSCTYCKYTCSRIAQLTRHMLTHTGTKSHACPLCDYKCNEKGNLTKHLANHGDDKPYACPEEGCDYRCKLKCNFTTHMRKHSGEKPYECNLCDYSSFAKGDITSHMFKHSREKPFSCPEEGCDYKCKLKCNLKTHILKHSGEKPYACHLCDYKSFTKGDLATHMFKHSGEKPFPCSVCGNRYASKGDLNVHMRIHTNDKKFKCQQCDYRGFTQQKVNQHMLTHTGEKPHECDECGFRFTSTSNLKRHMRTHNGDKPYACTECDYTTVQKGKLKIHMQAHITGQKPFACPPSAKPLWHQGSSSIPAVNSDGYNYQVLSDKLLYTRKVNTHAGENLAHISQNYSHNPLAPYPRPMFIDSSQHTHLNSKIPSTAPVQPTMYEMIQHANDMYNTQ